MRLKYGMRILAYLVMGFGIALTGGGVYYVSEFQKQQVAGPVIAEYVTVLAAREPLAGGASLDAKHLKFINWPRGAVPEGAFTSLSDLFGDLGDRPRFVLRSFEPGELILAGKLSDTGGLKLQSGMRAVSFSVDAVSSVSGFARAGDHVDILLIHATDGGLTSQVILQDVSVFAVDQTLEGGVGSPQVGRTVTVAVVPEDAQTISLAQRLGQLSLSLRGDHEPSEANLKSITNQDLIDSVKPVEPSRKTMRLRKGNVLEIVPVD